MKMKSSSRINIVIGNNECEKHLSLHFIFLIGTGEPTNADDRELITYIGKLYGGTSKNFKYNFTFDLKFQYRLYIQRQ
jgi:hypothetical protein